MTTEKLYRCNFCNDRHKPESLYGIHWTLSDSMQLKEPATVENHLCEKCFVGIVALGKQIGNSNDLP